jgi:hypothetical protein
METAFLRYLAIGQGPRRKWVSILNINKNSMIHQNKKINWKNNYDSSFFFIVMENNHDSGTFLNRGLKSKCQ